MKKYIAIKRTYKIHFYCFLIFVAKLFHVWLLHGICLLSASVIFTSIQKATNSFYLDSKSKLKIATRWWLNEEKDKKNGGSNKFIKQFWSFKVGPRFLCWLLSNRFFFVFSASVAAHFGICYWNSLVILFFYTYIWFVRPFCFVITKWYIVGGWKSIGKRVQKNVPKEWEKRNISVRGKSFTNFQLYTGWSHKKKLVECKNLI